MAVLPTPGSPMRTGLFFVRRESTCMTRSISFARPMTGSSFCSRALTPGWQVQPMIAACHELGATYAHPCFRPIEPSMIDAFHQAGLLIMTPHTNDPAEAQYFAQIGVNVIASDDPRILSPLRALTGT